MPQTSSAELPKILAPPRPHLIGIAGGSGAGKTTLAQALTHTLGNAAILPMDAYYHDLTHLDPSIRRGQNFDVPEAFEWDRFVADLVALRAGRPIHRPVYDFTTHTRRTENVQVKPGKYLIVEGLFVLHDEHVRNLLHTAIFLEVDHVTALTRRIARDRRIRARTPRQIEAQFVGDVLPMYERHIQPTARWADVKISGAASVDTIIRQLLSRIVKRSPPGPSATTRSGKPAS